MSLPMLAVPSTGASGRPARKIEDLVDGSGDWVADVKLDGERAMTRDGRIYNRRGTDITAKFPEIFAHPSAWLDGEIVAVDGSFETTLWRASLESRSAIARAADQKRCRFIAFDLLQTGIAVVHDQPWSFRRQALEALDVPVTPTSTSAWLFEGTREAGLEGVIAKRANARYQFGKRSDDWVKFKHLHRVSCIAVGYTEGSGSREHMGAIQLALLGPDGPVSVGRAGSGFTVSETHLIKQVIDAGVMPVVEIECTHVTSGGTLRFPVYRGVRNDIALTDCTIDQLDTLPRSNAPV